MTSHRLQAFPFAPVIYNPEVGDLSELIAPPYDVIDEEQCKQLLARHPYNIVRLILPPSLDTDDLNRYERAASLWREWLRKGVLVELDEPSIFVYLQRFSIGERIREHLSLIALMSLFGYETNLVRPHEHTMPKPKTDRLELLKATGAEFGQIHGLLSDETGEWSQLLQTVIKEPCWLKANLDGVEHIVWRVTDKGFVGEVNRLLETQWLVIADGHHRYETAIAFRDGIDEAKVKSNHPANFIGIVLADYQRNATVLPTHRLLRLENQELVERVFGEIRRRFWCEEVDWDGKANSLERIWDNARGFPFVFALQGRNLLVTVTGIEGNVNQLLEQLPQPLRKVDTAILHQAVLPTLFASIGVGPGDLTIEYTHDSQYAYQFAQKEGNIAILLRPISLELVREVAAQGYRLPPKTTYFVPKIPSGLVMRKILNR